MGRLSGSLRCHYGNDNENVTKTIAFRLGKQQLSTCITLFCTCLCRHSTTTTWMAQFHVISKTRTYDDEILFLFLNLNIFLDNSTPGKFAYIRQSERVEIIALNFLSEVFAAFAVVVRTLRAEDGDGSENVAEKVNSRSFNLHRDYSKSLTLSNVGEPS